MCLTLCVCVCVLHILHVFDHVFMDFRHFWLTLFYLHAVFYVTDASGDKVRNEDTISHIEKVNSSSFKT